jgi:hypothetical protein
LARIEDEIAVGLKGSQSLSSDNLITSNESKTAYQQPSAASHYNLLHLTPVSSFRLESSFSDSTAAADQAENMLTLDEALKNAVLPRMNGESAPAYKVRLEKRLAALQTVEKQLEDDVKEFMEAVRSAKDEVSISLQVCLLPR